MTTAKTEIQSPIIETQRQEQRQPFLRVREAFLSYCLMFAALVLIGLPVYWMIAAAFKETAEIYRIPVTWFPLEPTLRNFSRAWQAAPFDRYYLNSLITTIVGSGVKMVFAVTSAYAFAFQIGRAHV